MPRPAARSWSRETRYRRHFARFPPRKPRLSSGGASRTSGATATTNRAPPVHVRPAVAAVVAVAAAAVVVVVAAAVVAAAAVVVAAAAAVVVAAAVVGQMAVPGLLLAELAALHSSLGCPSGAFRNPTSTCGLKTNPWRLTR